MTESRIAGIRRLFRLPASRRSVQADVDDEIRFHLESRTEELCRRGLPYASAREVAEREFGDLQASRAELGKMEQRRHAKRRVRELVASIAQDVRYAARGLVHRPALAVVTVVTLTLGIGANVVVFSIVDQLLLRAPAHVDNASTLRQVYVLARDEEGGHDYAETTSYAVVQALRERVAAFADVVAMARRSFILGRGVTAEPVNVSLVDGNYFSALGTRPAAGRLFVPNDRRAPLGTPAAVLSSQLAERRFGSLTGAIGQPLMVDGVALTVVGVAPRGFSGVDREARTDLWVPVGALAAARFGRDWHTDPGVRPFHAIVRLREATNVDVAASQATAVVRDVARAAHDPELDTLATTVLGSINNVVTPDGMSAQAKTALWLMGVSAMVLLIAGANVANLGVARAMQRRREIAVRLALGISQRRLLRQLLVDAMLPALLAAGAAILASSWATRLVERLLLPGFAWAEGWMGWRMLAFALVAMVMACVLAGLTPAALMLRTDVNHALKAGARQWTGSRSMIRDGLLVAQAALSVVLLVGAGLFVRSLGQVRAADVGIDLDHVAIVTMDLERAGYDTVRQRVTYEAARAMLGRTLGVAAATVVGASTPTRIGVSIEATVPERPEKREPKHGGPYYAAIDDGFLATLGTRVRRGRGLLPDELRSGARVALVNQTTADFYWPGQDPLGRCLMLGHDRACTTIVGVVQPVMQFRVVAEARYAQLFIPAAHPAAGTHPRTLFLRTVGDASALSTARAALQQLAPDVPYVGLRSLADVVAPQLQTWRLGATMFTVFGLIALAIAAIGLYSVMAYRVSQRTYEFGVRMALGAQGRDIQRAVTREAARTTGVGLGLGVVTAWLAAPRLGDLLFETSAHDVRVYVVAVGALCIAAAAATVVPTRRSTRGSLVALRAD